MAKKSMAFVRITAILIMGYCSGHSGPATRPAAENLADIYRLGILWNDSLLAGDTIPLKAYVINQPGDTVSDTAVLNRLSWGFDPAYPPLPSDSTILRVTGDSVLLTGNHCRMLHILVTLADASPPVDTSITIPVLPEAPTHLVIEPAGTPLPDKNNPFGIITIRLPQASERVYAVLRDRFQSFAGYSQVTLWSSNQSRIVTVPAGGGGNAAIGEAILTNAGTTGTAFIEAIDSGSGFRDTVAVTIIPEDCPSSIAIYNSENPPGCANVELPGPPRVITAAAGTPFLLVAKIFDWSGVWVHHDQLSGLQSRISWRAFDRFGSLNSCLDSLSGDVTRFTPVRAYDTVTIIAAFQADSSTRIMDTAGLVIAPALSDRLVLETGPINLIQPNELDTLYIPAGVQSAEVYSILRDSYGNFVRYATISLWGSLDTSIVKVRKGDSLFGECIVTRNPTAIGSITKVYAVDSSSGLKDTFVVKLFSQGVDNRLRILTGSTVAPDTLFLKTDQDTTLSVQGWRSTDSVWIDVSATWQNSANLKIDPPAPTGNSWRFSPSDTGSGWIRVTMNDDIHTRPDSVFVIFTKGASIISGNPPFIRSDRFTSSASGGFTRIHIPLRGTHLITAYSLAGTIVHSSRTYANDAQIRLPSGVFIITVQTIGSQERFEAKVFSP